MPVTIYEVAAKASVSASTVSRAFTVPDLVSRDTLRRVLDAADELGYQPNRAARALITGKTGNIGDRRPGHQQPVLRRDAQGHVGAGPRERARPVPRRHRRGPGGRGGHRPGDGEAGRRPAAVLLPRLPSSACSSSPRACRAGLRQPHRRRRAQRGHGQRATAPGRPSSTWPPSATGRIAYLCGPAASWSNGQRRGGLCSRPRRPPASRWWSWARSRRSFASGLQAADLVLAERRHRRASPTTTSWPSACWRAWPPAACGCRRTSASSAATTSRWPRWRPRRSPPSPCRSRRRAVPPSTCCCAGSRSPRAPRRPAAPLARAPSCSSARPLCRRPAAPVCRSPHRGERTPRGGLTMRRTRGGRLRSAGLLAAPGGPRDRLRLAEQPAARRAAAASGAPVPTSRRSRSCSTCSTSPATCS